MTARQTQPPGGSAESETPAERQGGMRLSMHNGVAVSCDCCSCEAEPYWLAAAGEPGNDGGWKDGDSDSAAAHDK